MDRAVGILRDVEWPLRFSFGGTLAEPKRGASRAVTLIGAATAFSLLGDQTLYSVLPTAYTQMGLMPYQVGLVLSANRWIRLVTNHLAERMCGRFDPRRLVVFAFGLGAALTLFYGLRPAFAWLILARGMWGLCWSFIRQIGVMTVADASANRAMGRMMGVYSGISRTGSMAGNFVGALGHDLIGFTSTMGVFAAASLLAVPLGLLSRREVTEHAPPPRPPGFDAASPGLLACGFLVGAVGHGLLMSTLGLMMRATVGEGVTWGPVTIGVATLTGALMAARWVSDLAGAPVLGHLSDVLGRRVTAVVYFGAGAAALCAGAATTGLFALVLAVIAFFLCAVGATTVLMAEAGSRGPKTVASYVTAADIGSAVGPVLGWSSEQMHWTSDAIFWLGAILYGAGSLVSLTTVGKK